MALSDEEIRELQVLIRTEIREAVSDVVIQLHEKHGNPDVQMALWTIHQHAVPILTERIENAKKGI